jgi:hypothetical protein
MSSKVHVLKAWTTADGAFGRWYDLEEVGLVERSEIPKDVPLKGLLEPSYFSLAGHHDVGSFALPYTLHHDVWPCHRPKVTGPRNHGLQPLKPGTELILSSFKVVCHGNRKLTTEKIASEKCSCC